LKPTRFIDSLNCAIEGIISAAGTEKHMRNHFLGAILVLVASLFLGVAPIEFALLSISISIVLFAELMNTAIEAVVDLVSPGFHPMAKTAKDVAAGSVLISVVGAVVTGYIILSSHIFPLYKELLAMIGTPAEMSAVVSLLIVIIVVVILKSKSGKGTPLKGGVISGHAAVAFSIAMIVSVNTQDPITSILTLCLAVMVSHSRLLMEVHTMREVLCGAAAGSLITLAVLFLFKGLR
jgi:diacylglycerol kinase (ATP)